MGFCASEVAQREVFPGRVNRCIVDDVGLRRGCRRYTSAKHTCEIIGSYRGNLCLSVSSCGEEAIVGPQDVATRIIGIVDPHDGTVGVAVISRTFPLDTMFKGGATSIVSERAPRWSLVHRRYCIVDSLLMDPVPIHAN